MQAGLGELGDDAEVRPEVIPQRAEPPYGICGVLGDVAAEGLGAGHRPRRVKGRRRLAQTLRAASPRDGCRAIRPDADAVAPVLRPILAELRATPHRWRQPDRGRPGKGIASAARRAAMGQGGWEKMVPVGGTTVLVSSLVANLPRLRLVAALLAALVLALLNPVILREDREGAHRDMWQSVQKYLTDAKDRGSAN